MDRDETKKTTVEETPGERKTTEEIHRPGTPSRDDTVTTHQPGKPAQDEKKTTTETR